MKKMVLRVLSIMMIAAIMVISTNSVAALAAENLDISSRVFVSDAAPADNADGSITFSEQKSMKCSFALPTVLNAGESVTVNVKLQFNSADDAAYTLLKQLKATTKNILLIHINLFSFFSPFINS